VPTVPDHVIAEIRDRVDLVEFVGQYVDLKRSGRAFVGLCPFHSEKTPSFHVNPDRGIYHCFGCNVTGDLFQFYMEEESSSFPEALREMARRAGVDLSRYEGRPGKPGERDAMFRAHEVAATLFRKVLASREGAPARAELERRALPEEVLAKYRVGASSDSWDCLLKAAAREGLSGDLLAKAGLAIARDGKSGHYDRFRDRLMFPIEAPGGKIIGFGGRVLGEGEPKYLNTPETPLFQKRRTLYGLPQAARSIRESREAVLVEGYTDVLALAAVGVENAVASLGTAFTAEHAKVLARNAERVTVVFDGDEAGRRAAHAGTGPLLAEGLEVRMAEMPPGEDPDSMVRQSGVGEFRRCLEEAPGAVEALLGQDAFAEGAARDRAVRRVLDALDGIEDRLRRRVYLQDLSRRTGIPVGLLESRPRDRAAEKRRSREAAEAAPVRRETPDAPPSRPSQPERALLGIMLHDVSLAESLLERLAPSDFEDDLVRHVVEEAGEIAAGGREPSVENLLDALRESKAAAELVGRLSVSPEYAVETKQQAEDCVRVLERRSLKREASGLLDEVRRAEACGQEEEVREIMGRHAEVKRRIAALEKR
jgi:DNA primase